MGAGRAGLLAAPHLGDLGLGHPHGDRYGPVRRHHGAPGAQPGHRGPPGPKSHRRALLERHREEQGAGRAAGQGQAHRDPHRQRGPQLRLRARPQGLREPEIRAALGLLEPPHPRRRGRHPHGQAVQADPASREGRRDRRQRHPAAQRADQPGQRARRHLVQPAQGRPSPRATPSGSPSCRSPRCPSSAPSST